MNRRDAMKALAGAFGVAMVDPSNLIRESQSIRQRHQDWTFRTESNFLLKEIRFYLPDTTLRSPAKILIDGAAAFELPVDHRANYMLQVPILLKEGTTVQLVRDPGLYSSFSGIRVQNGTPKFQTMRDAERVEETWSVPANASFDFFMYALHRSL